MEKTIVCLNEPFTAKLRLEFKNGANYIGIDMPNISAFAKLTDDQVKELIEFLNEWKVLTE
jgi:hypothetical protein